MGAVRGNYWVAVPGCVLKASPEQMRPANAEERAAWRLVEASLRTNTVDLENLKAQYYHDITGSERPIDVSEEPEEGDAGASAPAGPPRGPVEAHASAQEEGAAPPATAASAPQNGSEDVSEDRDPPSAGAEGEPGLESTPSPAEGIQAESSPPFQRRAPRGPAAHVGKKVRSAAEPTSGSSWCPPPSLTPMAPRVPSHACTVPTFVTGLYMYKSKVSVCVRVVPGELRRTESWLLRPRRNKTAAQDGDRDNMRGDIEGSILDEYDQLFTRYRERSVVPVDVGICGGCNMTLSPQTLADLKGTKAVHCNNCRRLLYRV